MHYNRYTAKNFIMFQKIEEKRIGIGYPKRKFLNELQMNNSQYKKFLSGEAGSVKKLIRMCELLNLKIKITL